ncbi:MAG: hypothetical protein KGL39_52705, partial [Patescibacteria group bacterium]|nr:hypothetical protein [Patescibacteria group bacterium]
RSIGGVHRVHEAMRTGEVTWARKEFLERYKLSEAVESVELRQLPDAVQGIMKQIGDGGKR